LCFFWGIPTSSYGSIAYFREDHFSGGRPGRGGQDKLVGREGNDIFEFDSAAETGLGATRDQITDFEDYGDNDTIDLTGFAGTLSFIGDNPFSAVGQVRAIQSGSHVLVQINTTGTSGAEGEILLLNTRLSQVDATDFLL